MDKAAGAKAAAVRARKKSKMDLREDVAEKKKGVQEDAAVGSISHILKTLFRGLYEDEAQAKLAAEQEALAAREASSSKKRRKSTSRGSAEDMPEEEEEAEASEAEEEEAAEVKMELQEAPRRAELNVDVDASGARREAARGFHLVQL